MKDPITATILNNEVALDYPCWSCDGGTEKDAEGKGLWTDGVCDVCKGKGYKLTDVGEAIMELVKRYL